jgi:type IX secretion system PorP/SprF family membrane protein
MNTRNNIYTFVLMTILLTHVGVQAQQQTHYTQYMFSGLVINPAYAGTDDALSVTFINRHQWAGIDGAPVTQTFALHGLNKRKNVGLGLLVSNDKIGVHKNLYARSSFAYHLKVAEKSVVSFGLQAGIAHLRSDYGSLISSGSPDPKLSNVRINQLFFDLGAGLYFRSQRLHAGISLPELVNKSASVNDSTNVSLKSANLFGFAKYRIDLTPVWGMQPALLIKHFTNVPISLDVSLTVTYKEILRGGMSYRKDESIAYLFMIRATPQLQLGYSYDNPLATSRFKTGSHELMVQYLFLFERSGLKSSRI